MTDNQLRLNRALTALSGGNKPAKKWTESEIYDELLKCRGRDVSTLTLEGEFATRRFADTAVNHGFDFKVNPTIPNFTIYW